MAKYSEMFPLLKPTKEPFSSVRRIYDTASDVYLFDSQNSNRIRTGYFEAYNDFLFCAWIAVDAAKVHTLISKQNYYATTSQSFPFSLELNAALTALTVVLDGGNDYAADQQYTVTLDSPLVLNEWVHIGYVYSGTNDYSRLYLNGTLISDVATTVTLGQDATVEWCIGGKNLYNGGGTAENREFSGLMQRIVFSPNTIDESVFEKEYTRGLTNEELVINTDPYVYANTLHLKFDGADGGILFRDSSPKTLNAVTANGSPVTTQALAKYGQSCLSLNGSSYLTLPAGSNWNFGTGNFTIEMWVNGLSTSASTSSYSALVSNAPDVGATTAGWLMMVNDIGGGDTTFSFNASTGGGTWNVFTGGSGITPVSLLATVWNHIACVRQNNNMLFFFNGVLINTIAFVSATMPTSTQNLTIGRMSNNFFPLVGYMDSLRITKGVARYTTNFNPETDTYLSY